MKYYRIGFYVVMFFLSIATQQYIKAQPYIYTLDELVNYSNYIVLGTTVSITPYFGPGNRIYSNITFRITEVHKGNLQRNGELKFNLLGGTIGSRTTGVLESPHFSEGKESVLFLKKAKSVQGSQNSFYVVGLAQGKFDVINVDNKRSIVRDKLMPEPLAVRLKNGPQFVDNKNNIDYTEFVNKLSELIK